MSPMAATDEPNLSPGSRTGPPAVALLISTVSWTVPSGFIMMTWRAPRLSPPAPASSPSAPAARSGTPSPLMSPMPAVDMPKLSAGPRTGPLVVAPFISTVFWTVPSAFIIMTWRAPTWSPPARSYGAPTARSGTPSPFRSPMAATDEPNLSPGSRTGPLEVALFISTVSRTVPSGFIMMTWRAPRSESPSYGAPTARSGTPSPSRSPTAAADAPKESPSLREGPLAVVPFTSAAWATWPFPRGAATSR